MGTTALKLSLSKVVTVALGALVLTGGVMATDCWRRVDSNTCSSAAFDGFRTCGSTPCADEYISVSDCDYKMPQVPPNGWKESSWIDTSNPCTILYKHCSGGDCVPDASPTSFTITCWEPRGQWDC